MKIKRINGEIESYYNRTIETNLSRIYQHASDGSGFTISASRDEYSEEENNSRTRKLKQDLHSYGYGFIPLIGIFVENGAEIVETAIFIPFNESYGTFEEIRENLIQISAKWEQDSILSNNNGKVCLHYMGGSEVSVGNFEFDSNTNPPFFTMLAKGNRRNQKWEFEGVLAKPDTVAGLIMAFKQGELI